MSKKPKNPFHPGESLLEEFLEPTGMTQTAFAEKVGWTRTGLAAQQGLYQRAWRHHIYPTSHS